VIFRKSFTIALSLSTLCACSGLFSTEQPASRLSEAQKRPIENSVSDVRIESELANSRLKDSPASNPDLEYGVEVTWDIPEEAVDGYILYSGTEKDNYSSEIHLKLTEINTVLPNKYSYIIAPVDPEKALFVAVAAKKGDSISERSEAQELRPQAKFDLP
jgi:hypothetical protein